MSRRWLKVPGGLKVLSTPHTRSKYGNVKTGGYSSRKEAKRAAELKQLEKAGALTELKEQVRFELIPKNAVERSCAYVADFAYREGALYVVEDCKGMRTPAYIIKRKLMLHVHGIRIKEV